MKLIDILARDLEEWSEGYNYIAQDEDDCTVWLYPERPVRKRDKGGDYWDSDHAVIEMSSELAEDHASAIVTHDQWQSARAAYLRSELERKEATQEDCSAEIQGLLDMTHKENPKEDKDGWIEWHGGECPVDGDALVDVLYRDGDVGRNATADAYYWHHGDDYLDIVAYRLHREEKEDRRPPIVEGEPRNNDHIIDAFSSVPHIEDMRGSSPQELAYAAKQEAKKAQHEAACLAEHVRREQDWANVLKTADPHAYLLGVGQYREGDND